ncbi:hypothetical protein AMAG_09214 [Allomyces macrogynus ATCC 38327]|uniref:RRM domain-containing protein n=1 Tax=Allomyces macrogynus (strain ATCC 38327) TaxID=578462 RepID=A0A0L0SNS7_ALLM3|nr:hypothetical protein, variant [Allomyces macrogynus ATCC 38327]KNE64173.1 hypothetical protein AMAG_09214 [Allomyces macrogynus ATCC 38327]|eukprot:KNE64172.1 hypothetical protein, variant [Allomyces macrogynus ATCC 38327]
MSASPAPASPTAPAPASPIREYNQQVAAREAADAAAAVAAAAALADAAAAADEAAIAAAAAAAAAAADGTAAVSKPVSALPNEKPAAPASSYAGDDLDDDRDAANPGNQLYVRGLGFRCTEEDVRELFEPYGPILELSLVRDPHLNECRGFAFVKFATIEESQKAIEGENGREFRGRTLIVEHSRRTRPRPKTPGEYLGRHPPRREFHDRARRPYGSERPYDRDRGYDRSYDRGGYPPRDRSYDRPSYDRGGYDRPAYDRGAPYYGSGGGYSGYGRDRDPYSARERSPPRSSAPREQYAAAGGDYAGYYAGAGGREYGGYDREYLPPPPPRSVPRDAYPPRDRSAGGYAPDRRAPPMPVPGGVDDVYAAYSGGRGATAAPGADYGYGAARGDEYGRR